MPIMRMPSRSLSSFSCTIDFRMSTLLLENAIASSRPRNAAAMMLPVLRSYGTHGDCFNCAFTDTCFSVTIDAIACSSACCTLAVVYTAVHSDGGETAPQRGGKLFS